MGKLMKYTRDILLAPGIIKPWIDIAMSLDFRVLILNMWHLTVKSCSV